MGHKRIGNKKIKQMLNELLPLDNQAKSNALLVDEKDSKNTKKGKLRLDEAQK